MTPNEPPYEHPDASTSAKIATELRRLGLHRLAQRADKGEFSDYTTPHIAPQHVLVAELERAIRFKLVDNLQGVADMKNAVIAGEYDSTPEESAAWGNSEDGKAALASLGLASMDEVWEELGGDGMTPESIEKFIKDNINRNRKRQP